MPVFTTPVSNQNTSFSGGVRSYPQIGTAEQYMILIDEFNRETLQPSNSYVLYTDAGASTGSSTISNRRVVSINTAATLNDSQTLRTSGLGISRSTFFVDGRTNVSIDVCFSLVSTANISFFIGLLDSSTAITSKPTTTRHMGINYDTSVDTNIRFTSANGTSQTTSICSTANANEYRLNIAWTGDDSATINLYGGVSQTDVSTLISSFTVSSFLSGLTPQASFPLYFFVKDLVGTGKSISCQEWSVRCT